MRSTLAPAWVYLGTEVSGPSATLYVQRGGEPVVAVRVAVGGLPNQYAGYLQMNFPGIQVPEDGIPITPVEPIVATSASMPALMRRKIRLGQGETRPTSATSLVRAGPYRRGG